MFLGSFFLDLLFSLLGGKKNHKNFGGKKIHFSEAPFFGRFEKMVLFSQVPLSS